MRRQSTTCCSLGNLVSPLSSEASTKAKTRVSFALLQQRLLVSLLRLSTRCAFVIQRIAGVENGPVTHTHSRKMTANKRCWCRRTSEKHTHESDDWNVNGTCGGFMCSGVQ